MNVLIKQMLTVVFLNLVRIRYKVGVVKGIIFISANENCADIHDNASEVDLLQPRKIDSGLVLGMSSWLQIIYIIM